jgi:hypothetical protein
VLLSCCLIFLVRFNDILEGFGGFGGGGVGVDVIISSFNIL